MIGGDYLGAASQAMQKAGFNKASTALDIASDITSFTPLGLATDFIRTIGTNDPEFVKKLQAAIDNAKNTGNTQIFYHPPNLPGPLKIFSKLGQLFTGEEAQMSFYVDPKGNLLSNYDDLTKNS